jgi:predicted RNase H-like HicB family nuclease
LIGKKTFLNKEKVMQYQILVKQQTNSSFLATALGIPQCTVEAQTKEQAIFKAKEAIENLLTQGEIFVVEVETINSNPWLKMHGQLKNEPMFDDFLVEVKAYRDFLDKQE